MRRLLVLCLLGGGCALRTLPAGSAPPELMGAFVDDYGNAFRLTPTRFEQRPDGQFEIVEWNTEERYFLARNGDANPSDPGRWTRVDWMTFTGMTPYSWGFCLTAYRAATLDAARATPPADRAAPRSGCNGFPFSRMRPADAPAP